jgi:hypothetical protein
MSFGDFQFVPNRTMEVSTLANVRVRYSSSQNAHPVVSTAPLICNVPMNSREFIYGVDERKKYLRVPGGLLFQATKFTSQPPSVSKSSTVTAPYLTGGSLLPLLLSSKVIACGAIVPSLVYSDLELDDYTWLDVIEIIEQYLAPVCVRHIVVPQRCDYLLQLRFHPTHLGENYHFAASLGVREFKHVDEDTSKSRCCDIEDFTFYSHSFMAVELLKHACKLRFLKVVFEESGDWVGEDDTRGRYTLELPTEVIFLQLHEDARIQHLSLCGAMGSAHCRFIRSVSLGEDIYTDGVCSNHYSTNGSQLYYDEDGLYPVDADWGSIMPSVVCQSPSEKHPIPSNCPYPPLNCSALTVLHFENLILRQSTFTFISRNAIALQRYEIIRCLFARTTLISVVENPEQLPFLQSFTWISTTTSGNYGSLDLGFLASRPKLVHLHIFSSRETFKNWRDDHIQFEGFYPGEPHQNFGLQSLPCLKYLSLSGTTRFGYGAEELTPTLNLSSQFRAPLLESVDLLNPTLSTLVQLSKAPLLRRLRIKLEHQRFRICEDAYDDRCLDMFSSLETIHLIGANIYRVFI